MGYLDPVVSGMINLFIPALSVFAYWQAMTRLDERAKTTRAGREDGMGKAPGVDALYESDPFRTGAVHALIAFFLYALLLGMALGLPRWTSSRIVAKRFVRFIRCSWCC